MAQWQNEFLKFLKKLNPDAVNAIFLSLLAALIIGFSVFYAIMNINGSERLKQLGALENLKSGIREKQTDFLGDIQELREKAYLYQVTGQAAERFQALYALKNSGQSFQAFSKLLLSDIKDPGIANLLLEIRKETTAHNNELLGILTKESSLPDFMNDNANDTTTDSTSVQANLFDLANAGTPELDAAAVEAMARNIDDLIYQLDATIDGQMSKKQAAIIQNNQGYLLILFIVLSAIFTLVLATVLRRRLQRLIHESSKLLGRISRGELPEKVDGLGNVFENIRQNIQLLVEYLRDASRFARQIGDMKFEDEFEPKSNKDSLGNALLEMRSRLQSVSRETNIRDWTNQGHSKFADILRQSNESMEDIANKLIAGLVEYLGASQGALFIINDLDENDKYLELLSAYAFDRQKFVNKKLQLGEGLVGQAYVEGKTVHITDIRFDHFNIVTGLGESRPSAILIVPLKEEDTIEGVVELASFDPLEAHQIHFVEKVGEIIASYIRTGKVNRTTRHLLEETQEKAEQMKAQEEELRQNMEELAATQEQVERRNKELEEIQHKLNEEQYLLNALLSSTHDYIYFKDKESRFIRVSDSMVKLFDKTAQEEVVGKSDFDFQGKEHAQEAFDGEQRIIETGEPILNVVEKETWDDGHVTWVSTTKNPLKDQKGVTIGTFGISRDVTSSKMTEIEVSKQREWLEQYFKFNDHVFVVADQHGKINFATKSILDQFDKETWTNSQFGDLFTEPTLTEFLRNIDFENPDAKETELSMKLNNAQKTTARFLCYAGKHQNDDGTRNVFIIGI